MADSGISITFDPKTSQHFAELAELTKESIQELAERLFREAIEREEEDILLSVVANEYDVDGAEIVDFEGVK